MINLRTSYLGMNLRNPLIVSSSGLTNTVQKIKDVDRAGAGALVLKSLFEEQINHEAGVLLEQEDYPEAYDYITNYSKSNDVDEYLNLIEEGKRNVKIPIIASINCISASDWTDFAKKIEVAGADALELNIYYVATDKKVSAAKYEKDYFDIVAKVKSAINIPVSIKLSNQFTNIVYMAGELYNRGVDGLVLFNRFYQPDIDIDQMKIVSGSVFSHPDDIRNTLRWVAIVSDKLEKLPLAASTGVHEPKDVIKMILAGAHTVQICSTLYQKGLRKIREMINELEKWMESKNFGELADFRGKLNYSNIEDPSLYERSQFMRYFSSHE